MEVQRILLHFKRSEVIKRHNGITFIFYPGLPHTLQPLDSLMQGLLHQKGPTEYPTFRYMQFSLPLTLVQGTPPRDGEDRVRDAHQDREPGQEG